MIAYVFWPKVVGTECDKQSQPLGHLALAGLRAGLAFYNTAAAGSWVLRALGEDC